jgi:type II secretory ATPase GspE/PulE/Tfp pilus assembly ATPase PilB-like protein
MNALKEDKIFYVTIEASSAVTALGRWFKFFPDKGVVIDNLIGIVNQRMIRKLCNECKQAYTPNPKVVKKFGLVPEKAKILHREGEIEYDKHGNPLLCEMCQGTSFYGRTGVFELIMFDDALKASVKSAKSLQEIAVLLRRSGMRYLQEQAMLKVTDGTTSINEVVREFSTGKKKSAAKKEK